MRVSFSYSAGGANERAMKNISMYLKYIFLLSLCIIFIGIGFPINSFGSDAISPVKVATWKDAHKGVISISVDDSQGSCYDELNRNAFKGTYFIEGTNPPSFFTNYYFDGMELGSHTVNHLCTTYISNNVFQTQEIEPNIQAICKLPIFCDDIIGLSWPCGATSLSLQSITSDYFLSARGYNINQLEDPTPAVFQNLRSFNSHEHSPYPPADLKTVVDMAEQQGKWANLVFHTSCNDDGAIDYAATKDVWVAPIGSVVKYILQRDRFILTNYNEGSNLLSFSVSRLEIPSSTVRSFENAFGPEDVVTIQVDIDGLGPVNEVRVNGAAHPYQLKTIDGSNVLLLDTLLSVNATPIEITYNSTVSIISLSPTSLNFSVVAGAGSSSKTLSVSNSGGGSMSWTAVADSAAPAWLAVSPGSGTGNASLTVSVNPSGLLPGTYNKSITITAPGASNSPVILPVTLIVNAPGTTSTFYGDFGASGLWMWNGTSWAQLTPINPENMVVSGTMLYVDFGDYGLWRWDGTAWAQLTPATLKTWWPPVQCSMRISEIRPLEVGWQCMDSTHTCQS